MSIAESSPLLVILIYLAIGGFFIACLIPEVRKSTNKEDRDFWQFQITLLVICTVLITVLTLTAHSVFPEGKL